MTGRSYRSLLALTSCLKGNPPADVDWEHVIALANESLTVSSLARGEEICGDVPEDVRRYLL